MAPCRQVLIWSVPSIAVLLGIFWFRRKREFAKSEPGGREKVRSLQEELAEVLRAEASAAPLRENRIVAKSSPIDICANSTNSQRSSLEMTDEEVDIEIDKIIRKRSLEKERRSLPSAGIEVREAARQMPATFCTPTVTSRNSSPLTGKFCRPAAPDAADMEAAPAASPAAPAPAPAPAPAADRLAAPEQHDAARGDADTNKPSAAGESGKCAAPAQQARRSSERDSANHSPADAMLASPSMCHFSDNHSEGSSDSGKGCSEAASPPPVSISLAQSPDGLRIHHFVIPQTLVGLLIGKQGSFVTQVKAKTGANIFVKRHPDSIKLKICAVEGTQSEIEAAVDMIRRKFPEKKYPHLTLQEISADLFQRLTPLVPEFLQLQLVESVNNETIMTCLVSAGHFFLQQPLHPTFPSLQALHRLMGATYQCPDVPDLPRPIKEGSICAAPTENNWYRAQVVSTSEESDTSVVKLVDFGGYLTLGNSLLKQIRSDFMTLPFQATEALLAFVKPANGAAEWSGEALRIMAALTAGQLLYAQVAGYDEHGVPLTQLYLSMGAQQVIFLNSELVERGLAEWDLPQES